MTFRSLFRPRLIPLLVLALTEIMRADPNPVRHQELLSGPSWQFVGAGDGATLPELGSDAFAHAAWTDVTVPHIFQTRAAYETLTKGWYRRDVTIEASAQGRELYLVFEGAASVADVYVNGQHLGQHRGGYTRFVFDATKALHVGADNHLAVLVNDSAPDCLDCLPVPGPGLYKVWGGLYRKVWLLETSPIHIDPTDDGAPGVYLMPRNVSADSAFLGVKVLLRNASETSAHVQIRATIFDPHGAQVSTLGAFLTLTPHQQTTLPMMARMKHPQLWSPEEGRLYHVQTQVYLGDQLLDEVTQAAGFRWLKFDWKEGRVTVNGEPTVLAGVNIHQETEEKGSAVPDEDLTYNLDVAKDLGANFVRLAHYPRAQSEYDYCDQLGLMCWAENGNSTGRWNKRGDIVSTTSAQIATEMVKQNYNHPSIVLWSAGNEAVPEVADQAVPIIKAIDSSRPVVVANMGSKLADFHAANIYPGWYGGDLRDFSPRGFISEIGAGGVVTIHCDYNRCDWKVNSYEPEEYQQLAAEAIFQKAFHGDDKHLGLFCWWTLREFNDVKYKKPVGINSKGLLTYAGDKKDVWYLYRCFLRPDAPTLWIASKRYFLRRGAVDNGIKVYSNAKSVTLTLNGEKVSTLENGRYVIPGGPWEKPHDKKPATQEPVEPVVRTPVKVDNVFYWPVPLRPGKNSVSVTDDQGQSDSAIVYYEGGKDAVPSYEAALVTPPSSSNPANPAYFMDMPIQAQWPIYSDLDSTADNSWNTIPSEVEGAKWIALRRVTKPGQETNVTFSVTQPVKIYFVATKTEAAPPAGFTEIASTGASWRDNALQLVPVQLYAHEASAGEVVKIALGDRDAVILLKKK